MENHAPSGTMEKSTLDKPFDLGLIPAETLFFLLPDFNTRPVSLSGQERQALKYPSAVSMIDTNGCHIGRTVGPLI